MKRVLISSIIFSILILTACASIPDGGTATVSPTIAFTLTPALTATPTPAYPAFDLQSLEQWGLSADNLTVWQDQDGKWWAGEKKGEARLSLNERSEWVEMPNVDINKFFYLGENKELQVNLGDSLLKFPSGREIQLLFNEDMTARFHDFGLKFVWMLDNAHRVEVSQHPREYVDFVQSIPEDGILDQSCSLIASNPKDKSQGKIACSKEKLDVNSFRFRLDLPGSAIDNRPEKLGGGVQSGTVWVKVDGNVVSLAPIYGAVDTWYGSYYVDETMTDDQIKEIYDLMMEVVATDVDEVTKMKLDEIWKEMYSSAKGRTFAQKRKT